MRRKQHAQGNEPSQRQRRVGEQIRHIISETLQRGHFSHELLFNHAGDVTVSEVLPSPDLKHARVYVSTLSNIDIADILPVLNEEARVFQKAIGLSANLKFTPRIRFVVDESFENAQRIEEILRGVHIPQDTPEEDNHQ